MKAYLLLLLLVFFSGIAQGQIVIGDAVTLNISNVLSTNGSVYNSGSLLWDANSLLFLNGEGELLTTEGSTINHLKINGTYQLRSSIHVATSLTLLGGTLTPIENTQLLLLPGSSVASENGSYVAGLLYHQGTGEKFYPIGKNGIYTPVTLTNVHGDENVIVGLEAINESLDIDEQFQDWYWQITTEGNFEGSLIQLPILDAGAMTLTVLQSDGARTTDLGGNLVDDFMSVRSQIEGVGPYFLLGSDLEEEIALTIHNIVTPNRKDSKNDAFYIENIERYNENTVILMDRWGTEVCHMENFSNDPSGQLGCDLERLPAGNYICVVAYAGKKSTPALITILK